MLREEATHAGGIVFREAGGAVEFLLVEARRAPGQWVLPKGHIDPGETARETAVREVREESGVQAVIVGGPERVSFDTARGRATTLFFVMRAIDEGPALEARATVWLTLEAALARASHEQTKSLLRRAAVAMPDTGHPKGLIS
jgi:8-oxo-dGTP pyrophosphatase MutT (NUDIX family)